MPIACSKRPRSTGRARGTRSLENAERGQPVGDDAVVAVEMGNGYYGALELFPSRGNAYLGISTPCLPKGPADSDS